MVGHQGPGVVDQNLPWDPAKVPEGPFHALEPGTPTLVTEGPHITAPRVPEGGHKDRHPPDLPANLQAPAAEVDLHLLTRGRFKAHRGQRLGTRNSRRNGAQARSTVRNDTSTPNSPANSWRTTSALPR